MTKPVQVGSVDTKKATSAINIGNAARAEASAVCLFNGQSYSPGSQICSDGNLMRCETTGTWTVIGIC
jgi:Protein of unknown function (DUF1496)